MYKKRKKLIDRAINLKIEAMCDDLINFNSDALFIVSKKFVLKPDKSLGKELSCLPVVIVTKPIEQLIIPSSYFLTSNNELTTWCDNEELLVKLVYSNIKFTDGEIIKQYLICI